MAEDWFAIAAEVAAALTDVGFSATLTRPALGATPWDTNTPPEQSWTVVAMELGSRFLLGAAEPREVRALMIGAGVVEPRRGDHITLSGRAHEITWISPEHPGGVPLYFEIGVAI